MNPDSAVLLVIDVQQGFVTEASRGALPAITRLVQGWRAVGGSVIFTQFYNPPGSPYERITGWTRLRTAEECAIVPELAPYTSAAAGVVLKGQSSAFTPEGSDLIRRGGWSDLVLCGIDTDACVYDTATEAYRKGYCPWIVTDACASTGGVRYHEAALLLAGRNIGTQQLISSASALAQIDGHEERGECSWKTSYT